MIDNKCIDCSTKELKDAQGQTYAITPAPDGCPSDSNTDSDNNDDSGSGAGTGAGSSTSIGGGSSHTATPRTNSNCAPWQSPRYFKKNGGVKEKEFCKKYAKSFSKCKEAISEIKDITDQLKYYQSQKRDLMRELNDIEDTEAGAECIDCMVKKMRELNKPTTGQTVGNVLSILMGAGLGYVGIKEGRRARQETNRLRAQQGFEASHDTFGYTLAGLQLAYPFMSRGFYGLSQGNNRNFCNQGMNPYAIRSW